MGSRNFSEHGGHSTRININDETVTNVMRITKKRKSLSTIDLREHDQKIRYKCDIVPLGQSPPPFPLIIYNKQNKKKYFLLHI
jgi:hypothetical protein